METRGNSALRPSPPNGSAQDMGSVSKSSNWSRWASIHDRKLEEITMAKIRWYHWVMIGTGSLATFVGVTLLIWGTLLRGEAISYGNPVNTYFKPTEGIEGTDIQLCLDDVTWKRLCPSQLVTQLTPVRGSKLDLGAYPINVPPSVNPETGEELMLPHKLAKKCRWWKVPMLGENREAGAAVMTGYVRTECTPYLDQRWPIFAPFPPTAFNWLRAR